MVSMQQSPEHEETDIVRKQLSRPLQILGKFVSCGSHHEIQWWHDIGSLLARFLHVAQYDIHEQYFYLMFLSHTILPALGPYPNKWKSVITMTGVPIEYSLNFQQGVQPLLRIGLEPIGRLAGTPDDPFNHLAGTELVGELSKLGLKDFNTDLFDYFTHRFALSDEEGHALGNIGPMKTYGAFGFDFKQGEVSTKGYSFIRLKHKATGTPVGKLITDSVCKLPHMDCSVALGVLNEYMESTAGYNEYTFLSWDYVQPSKSRLKVYGVHAEATLTKAEEMWTLGGRFRDATTLTGLELVQRLWGLLEIDQHVASIPETFDDGTDPDTNKNLPPLIWNYEIRPGSTQPAPKLYFPLHGQNDLKVAQGLAKFFASLGWKDKAESYVDSVAYLYPNLDLSKTSRLQSWISLSYSEKTGPYLSVYYYTSQNYPWSD